MNKKSDIQRAEEFKQLGFFILQEYNRKTGILAYDPEGLYMDIDQQIGRICADEIKAVREVADEARAKLKTDIKVYRLECELAVSNAQIRAYERIFEMSHSFIAAVNKRPDDSEESLASLKATLPVRLEYKPEQEDAYTAFSIALHDVIQEMHKTNVRRLGDFTNWAKRTFRSPDPER